MWCVLSLGAALGSEAWRRWPAQGRVRTSEDAPRRETSLKDAARITPSHHSVTWHTKQGGGVQAVIAKSIWRDGDSTKDT